MAVIISKNNHLLILSVCLLSLSCFCSANNENRVGFKGMFVFGSSVVDNGNNNDLKGSTSKANFLPYGIDFVDGPTGRFSNGKNIADIIGEHLKLPLIPSFASQQHPHQNRDVNAFLHGVNYGSSGSGVFNETGSYLGKVITLHEQVTNFEGSTLPRLEHRLRRPRDKFLYKYLFLIAAGNNDYTFHPFYPFNSSHFPQAEAEAFAAKLLAAYNVQLKRLHKAGARNFLLLAPYPIGCAPGISKGKGCLTEMNRYVSVFYDLIISKIREMKREMPGSEFVVLNSVKVITEILTHGKSIGLSNVNDPCCELASNGLSCKVKGTPCPDRKKYAFFDLNHYTEAASAAIAAKVYGSRNASEIFPANLYRLAKRPRSIIH